MSAELLNDFLPPIAGWVWQTSLAATFVAVFIGLIQGLFKKIAPPRLRLLLWWLVLLRLLIPAPLPVPFSIWNSWKEPVWLPLEANALPDAPDNSAGVPERAPLEPAAFIRDGGLDWMMVAATAWLGGTLVSLLIVLVQHRKIARWVRRQPSLDQFDDLLQGAIRQMQLHRDVRLVETNFHGAPAVFGFRNPRILLPRNLLNTLNREQLNLVILHELAHVKRMDVLQNWLMIVLQCVHWFNPVIWLSFRRLRAERELVCDRKVLATLDDARRTLYGETLIQIASSVLSPRASPSLVPILSKKKNIERRVRMIAKFKPMSRVTAAVSAIAVALVAWVTLTGAADRPVAPQIAGPPPAVPQVQSADENDRLLDRMNRELHKLQELITHKQHEVDALRERLRISALEDSEQIDPEPLRRMESLRVEQAAEHQKLISLYKALTNMSRAEVLRAIVTASPDELLTSLLEQRGRTEQRLAEARDSFAGDHPNVKSTVRILKQIEEQIEGRLDGILEGLKLKTRSVQSSAQRLEEDIARARDTQIDRAIRSRPYFRTRRELENLQSIHDDLHKRLIQAQIDAAIAPRLLSK